ncbi:hypothetical protein JCM6882_001261 [Rhodosporidiobolus microsporus]
MGRKGDADWWISGSGWHVCGLCDRQFNGWSALLNHLRHSSQHDYCTECDREFASPAALRSHYANSSLHAFCTLCDTHCDDDDDLEEHQQQYHFECEACNLIFATEVGRYEHGRQSHPFCETHRRAFQSTANLRAHLDSSAHVSRNVPCPTGCGNSFVSRSAAILHLEAGRCPSGLTRAKIDYFVQQLDRSRLITSGSQKLLPAPESRSVSSTTYIATERSWDPNEGAYRCFLCSSSSRLFNSLHGLNQHLLSPKHTYSSDTFSGGDKLYKCPNVRCGRKFATLSGLVQHGESDSCGVMRVPVVQRTLDDVMGGMRMLTLG